MNKLALTFIVLNLFAFSTKSQTHTKVEGYSIFFKRADRPIQIEVTERDDKVYFFGKNRSLYTYEVTIVFKNMMNLRPAVSEKVFTVPHGSKKLIEFYKYNRDKGFQYQYSFRYKIEEPKNTPDLDFPYLVPVKSSSLTPFVSASNQILQNSFVPELNDTIYCMRKGLVMATPNLYHDLDRISSQLSIEVKHNDGTIMVYKNINKELADVKYGKYVYPGQPIAIVDNVNYVQTELFNHAGDGKFIELKIKYHLSDGSNEQFSAAIKGKQTNYPLELVTKELSKRELKRFKKGILYGEE